MADINKDDKKKKKKKRKDRKSSADAMASSLISKEKKKKQPKDKVDPKTGLTIVEPRPSDEPLTVDAQKKMDYEDRQKEKKNKSKITSHISLSRPSPDQPASQETYRTKGGELIVTPKKVLDDDSEPDPNAEAKEVLGADATEEEIADYNSEQRNLAAQEQETEDGEMPYLDPSVNEYEFYRKHKEKMERDFGENFDDEIEKVINLSSSPEDAEAKLAKRYGWDLTMARSVYRSSGAWRDLKAKQEAEDDAQDNRDGRAINQAMKAEVAQNSQTLEDLSDNLTLADAVSEVNDKTRKERTRKEKRNIKRAGKLISVLLNKFPNMSAEALSSMKPEDLFALAERAGVQDRMTKRERNLAKGYIDTVQTLGVQDYFPGISRNIAVGTFQGSRIGSQTIYAGGGGLAPMGLYDARRRAMKAGLNVSQKAIEHYVDFDKVPPPYRSEFKDAMESRYDQIASMDIPQSEKDRFLGRMSDQADGVLYAYNTAKNLKNRLLNLKNNEKDNIYVPDEVRKAMDEYIFNAFDGDYLDKVLSGEIDIARDVGQKLNMYTDLIDEARDLANDFKNFPKETSAEAFIKGLSDEDAANLKRWAKSGHSNAATTVLIDNYAKYYAKDVELAFKDAFYNEDGTIRGQYSKDQEDKALSLFKQMLAPSFESELKTVSTGLGSRLAHQRHLDEKKDERHYANTVWSTEKNNLAEEADVSTSKNDFASKLHENKGYRVLPNTSSFGQPNALAVEVAAGASDFYMDSGAGRFERSGGYKIRVRRGGPNGPMELVEASDLKRRIEGGDVYFADGVGNAKISESHVEDFIISSGVDPSYAKDLQFLVKSHLEAPAYVGDDNVKRYITNDSRFDEYKNSDRKLLFWQNIGQPNYMKLQGSEWVNVQAPFVVQGAPHRVDESSMRILDQNFKKQGQPQRDYDPEGQ